MLDIAYNLKFIKHIIETYAMAEGMYTYQLEPKEDERFYPSRAKAIIEEILNEKLKGTTYNSGKSAEVT